MDAKISTALKNFQGAIKNIELNAEVKVTTKTGGAYTFEYATLGQIMDTIRPHLLANGLSVSQKIAEGHLITYVIHESGEELLSKIPFLEGVKTAQELGSLITYSRRYGLVLALGLVAESDDDGNVATGNSAKQVEKKRAPVSSAIPTIEVCTDYIFDSIMQSGQFSLDSGMSKKTGKPWYVVTFKEKKYWITESQHKELSK